MSSPTRLTRERRCKLISVCTLRGLLGSLRHQKHEEKIEENEEIDDFFDQLKLKGQNFEQFPYYCGSVPQDS